MASPLQYKYNIIRSNSSSFGYKITASFFRKLKCKFSPWLLINSIVGGYLFGWLPHHCTSTNFHHLTRLKLNNVLAECFPDVEWHFLIYICNFQMYRATSYLNDIFFFNKKQNLHNIFLEVLDFLRHSKN